MQITAANAYAQLTCNEYDTKINHGPRDLIASIIIQAIKDLRDIQHITPTTSRRKIRAYLERYLDAKRYLTMYSNPYHEEGFEHHCQLLGVDATTVLNIFQSDLDLGHALYVQYRPKAWVPYLSTKL